MTTSRLWALPAEAQSKAAHTVATFSMDAHHGHYLAEVTLPFQMIEVTLVMVTGTIDSSYQVVIISKDLWQRLGTPMKHVQIMFMEFANGQSNASMGMIPSIFFSISKVSLHCLVQVVKDAPLNASSPCHSCLWLQPNANNSCTAVHTSSSPTQPQAHLSLF